MEPDQGKLGSQAGKFSGDKHSFTKPFLPFFSSVLGAEPKVLQDSHTLPHCTLDVPGIH